ncbi:MAG: nuclear transport factor 2 family protein [Novosphingobium sp.]
MTEAEMREMFARQAIGDVIHRYSRSMDRIDAELGYSVWHEDGTADYGSWFKGTGRGFIDWVCGYHRTLAGQFHQVSNISITLDGDRAGSETYVTVALLEGPSATGTMQMTTGRGRYVDRWSLRAGRWAIDHRQYVLDFAVTQDVAVMPGWGERSPADPSHAALAPG